MSHKLGETTNPRTIEALVGRYKIAHDVLGPQHPQLRLIDTTAFGEQDMVARLAAETLKILEQKTKSAK